MKVINLLGSRVVKTGVAVLLTAHICQMLNWPPVFAVITAIVTLEPTVSDSIKKGIVRFPASVIGSAYAVILIYFFGNIPITYALAAVLTIATCFKLNLHAGLLVATLTAVTMIEVIDSNYFLSFATRLGTTSIGLLVSTGVNMVVFPPDYRKSIAQNIKKISEQANNLLETTFSNLLYSEQHARIEQTVIDQLRLKIRQTEALVRFQNDESKYHPLVGQEKSQFLKAEGQLTWLRILHYHLDNLNRIPVNNLSWSEEELRLIHVSVLNLGSGLQNDANYNFEKHEEQLEQITKKFWEDNAVIMKAKEHPSAFPPELIILYELVAIYNLVDKFYHEKGT